MGAASGTMRVTSGKSRVRESRMPGSVRAKPNGRATRPTTLASLVDHALGRSRTPSGMTPHARGARAQSAVCAPALRQTVAPPTPRTSPVARKERPQEARGVRIDGGVRDCSGQHLVWQSPQSHSAATCVASRHAGHTDRRQRTPHHRLGHRHQPIRRTGQAITRNKTRCNREHCE